MTTSYFLNLLQMDIVDFLDTILPNALVVEINPSVHDEHFMEEKYVWSSVGSRQRSQLHVKNLLARRCFCRSAVPLIVYV